MAEMTASQLRNTVNNMERQNTKETKGVVNLLEVTLNEIETIKRDVAELGKNIR